MEVQKAIYNPTVRNNATWEVTVTLKKSDGTAYDLTGFTGQCQVRSSDGVKTVLATPTVTVTDQVNGVFKVFMSLAQTAVLPVTPCDNKRDKMPQYDVLLANADKSVVLEALEGHITVVAGVTTWSP